MANLQDLKAQMNNVPDHKMYHNKPIKGPLHEKKLSVAGKIPKKPIRFLSEAEQKDRTKNWPKGPVNEPTGKEKH